MYALHYRNEVSFFLYSIDLKQLGIILKAAVCKFCLFVAISV